MVDSVDVDGNMVQLKIIIEPVAHGSLGLWLKIAPNGHFGIFSFGDVASSSAQIKHLFRFFDDGHTDYNNGGVLTNGPNYLADQWLHFTYIWDIRTTTYSILFNDQVVVNNTRLSLCDSPDMRSFIFSCFSDTDVRYVLMDDIEVRHTADEGELSVLDCKDSPAGNTVLKTNTAKFNKR